MSGGAYNYAYIKLEDLADDIMKRNDHRAIRDEIADFLKQLSQICYIVEQIDSDDYGDEEWKEVAVILKDIKKNKLGMVALKGLEKNIKELKVLIENNAK